jgi:hypothetical protein
MAAIVAIIAFAIALIMEIGQVAAKGAFNVTTFMLIGLLCLAIHLVWGYAPWRNRAPRA